MRQPVKRAETYQPSQSSVVAALTTLSRLAVHTSTLRVTSDDVTQYWATQLLQHLLVLCAARQGAFFVAPQRSSSGASGAPSAILEQPEWSLWTSIHLGEDEARAALQVFAPSQDALQYSAASPAAVLWRRSLPPGFLSGSGPDNASFQATSVCSVALLLRWPSTDQHGQEDAPQQALRLLPCLADLVDTILLRILPACAEEEPLTEVFPADLLATIGHELRGPLTTIQGYAETLLRYEPQLALTERQEFLRAISQASAHIGTLVNRFLELAQFETQTHAFFPAPVQMQALAQEAITAAQARGSHRLLLLPATWPAPRAPTEAPHDENGGDALTITGDRRLLRSMLDILLENALAYSAPESLVEVVLVPRVYSASAAWSPLVLTDRPLALILPATFQDQEPVLEMCVRDHGRGIAPEDLSAIFRRFYRVDTRLTREVNGLGLGLTLCQAIVAQHHGMLWVESVLGEGSAFHLLLPRGTVATSDHDRDEIARPPKRKEEDR